MIEISAKICTLSSRHHHMPEGLILVFRRLVP